MAINSVQLKKGSTVETVKVGSTAYKNYISQGYILVAGSEKNAPKSSSSTFSGGSSSGSSSTPAPVSSGYYNINGAYFSGTPGALKTVTNTMTISQLKSGALKSISGGSELLFAPKTTGTTSTGDITGTDFKNSVSFKALSKDKQEMVISVFDTIAGNDLEKAKRMVETFKAYSDLNDPYFKQQLLMAVDMIERGYVQIDKEAEFTEQQLKKRHDDLKADYESRKEYLSLEEASAMKSIERQYGQDLENTRQNMAASGFTNSSRRVKTEGILNEATGDLRESTTRKFGYERTGEENELNRSQWGTAAELKRLAEVTATGKLDFLRKGEAEVGSANLPRLSGAPAALGGIYGSIPETQLKDTLSASASSFVF